MSLSALSHLCFITHGIFFWHMNFFTFVMLENHVHDFNEACNCSDHVHLNFVLNLFLHLK